MGEQIKELREAAGQFEGYQNGEVSRMMREAADTIESLRDILQPVPAELDYIEDKSRWFQLFGTPERAARMLIRTSVICHDVDSHCEACPLLEAPSCSSNLDDDDYDALLEWLREEGEAE